jgi:hypothetical protein
VRRASFFLIGLLFLAGCGGGGSGGGSGGGKRLSRADYAAKADAICNRQNSQVGKIKSPKNLADLADAFDSALPVLDKALADLEKLQPPKTEQTLADKWLAQSRVVRTELKDVRDKAKAKDLKGVQSAFAKAQGAKNASDDAARKLGMKACSKG